MSIYKNFVKLLIFGLLYTAVFFGFYHFCNIFLNKELSIAISIFLPSVLMTACLLHDENSIYMGNLSNEEKLLVNFILQNFPRELSKAFENNNFSNSEEWFAKAAPIIKFYKSFKEKLCEIEAQYFSNNI